jgi:hypothetical protein
VIRRFITFVRDVFWGCPLPVQQVVAVLSPVSLLNEPFVDHTYWHWIQRGCPDCGSKEYYSGPCGGCSENICCADCHSAFNLHHFPNELQDGILTDRIDNAYFTRYLCHEPASNAADTGS